MNNERITIVSLKFVGFLATLIAMILIAIFAAKIPLSEGILGSLTTLLIMQGRDLYRKELQGNGSDKV